MNEHPASTTDDDRNATIQRLEEENRIHAAAPVTIVTIPHMTMDSFEFWLNHDMPRINGVNGIRISLPLLEVGVTQWNQYVRALLIRWSVNDSEHFNRTAVVSWAQIHTDSIRAEIKSEGELYDFLKQWCRERLGVEEFGKGPDTLTAKSAPELTPTEAKVAQYLAQKKSYQEIAKLLGDRSIHAVRKHTQSLAKKWGTRQTIELLWNEAKAQGYDTIR